MERPWPVAGRDEELHRVAAAIKPGAAGIVVAGPAGVGKTRLAREALGLPEGRGWRVVWACGSAAARPLPLGAFAGLLDVPPGDASELISRTLDHLAQRKPFVLAVDDAHLLDEHSAIVLHRVVVRHLAAALITIRSGEQAPDVVTSVWKDDHLPRLDLAPLDLTETTGLVARVLGGPVESASAHRLWALTQGSPLFLRHLVTGEVAAGRLTPSSGIWRWTGEPAISAELAGLLEHEIGSLAAGVRVVVDLVTLAEPMAVPTLAALTSPEDLEEAEARGVVRTDGLVARLAHPLYGEVRRTAMGTVRARRLRGRVALTLDPTPDPIPRAVLTLDSDLAPDPELFLRAAEAATRMYDLPLAERLARAAASAGDPPARLLHAATMSWLSRGKEAEAILADLAGSAADPATRAWAHLHRAGNLLRTMARADEARQALAAAEATGAAPLTVTAMSLNLAAASGHFAQVIDRGRRLLHDDLPDDLTRIISASAVSAAAAVTGDLGLLEEAAIVGGLTTDRVPRGMPGFSLADVQVLGHRLAGTPGQAQERVRMMVAASADLPGPARLMGLVLAGHGALAEGRAGDALLVLREAWAGLADSGHEFRIRCRTLLATTLAHVGEAVHAAPLLADIVSEQHPVYGVFEPDDVLARAWGAAAEGSTTEALGHAAAAADLARERASPAYEVLAWQTAIQFGDATAALPRLAALAQLSPRAGVAHAHARAWADQDGESLLEAADAWTRLGGLLAAGDAAAQAADVHRRRGRAGSALSAAALAGKLADRSGARTPALKVAVLPLPLTAREREIGALATRGLSNRDIAERLTLSVRTVEGHLYRVGMKLGVSERAALAGIFGVE